MNFVQHINSIIAGDMQISVLSENLFEYNWHAPKIEGLSFLYSPTHK